MKCFVRAHQFAGDSFTSYWDGGNHQWGDLTSASVFSETEMRSFSRLPIRQCLDAPITGYHTSVRLDNGGDYYVPGEGSWVELPMVLRMRTAKELDAERDRRTEENHPGYRRYARKPYAGLVTQHENSTDWGS